MDGLMMVKPSGLRRTFGLERPYLGRGVRGAGHEALAVGRNRRRRDIACFHGRDRIAAVFPYPYGVIVGIGNDGLAVARHPDDLVLPGPLRQISPPTMFDVP